MRTLGRILNVAFVLAALAGTPALGAAQGGGAQVGIAAGSEYGFGGIARVGTPAVMLEVGGGIVPVLVFGTEEVRINGSVVSDDVFFEAFFPAAIGAKVSIRLQGADEDDNRFALKAGATYNALLRMGYGGGIDVRVSPRVYLGGGLMYYPEGDTELADKIAEERGYSRVFDLGPLARFQPFFGASFMFF